MTESERSIDTGAILQELKNQGRRLESIEKALETIAQQDTKIEMLQEQTNDLYTKHNNSFGSEGTISQLQQFQAACPRVQIEAQIKQMRWAIGIVATGELGLIAAIFTMIAKMGG